MSWRADSVASQAAELERSFLKAAKKLREIRKLAETGTVDALQQLKIDQKPILIDEIVKIDVGAELWDKNDDVKKIN